MLLIIFGAGASNDSAALGDRNINPELKPPLARELFVQRALFDSALRDYPQFTAHIQFLRDVSEQDGETVEAALQQLSEEADDLPIRHVQLAAVTFRGGVQVSFHAPRRSKEEWNTGGYETRGPHL